LSQVLLIQPWSEYWQSCRILCLRFSPHRPVFISERIGRQQDWKLEFDWLLKVAGRHNEKDVILYPDKVTAPQISRWQGRDEQLLRLPVVGAAGPDLAATDGGELPALGLHHLVLGDVLDRLGETGPGPFDGHLALVVDCGPDVDRLPRHVTSAVKTHATRDGTRGQTRHAQLVFYLTMEGLSQYCRLLVEVNGVHNNEDLLVLVSEAGVGLLEGSLAVVLDPAVFAQEGGGEAQRKTKLEWKTVNSRR